MKMRDFLFFQIGWWGAVAANLFFHLWGAHL